MKVNNRAGVARFSISLPAELAGLLDRMPREKGTKDRSLAVADMIRAHLGEHRQKLSVTQSCGQDQGFGRKRVNTTN